MMKRLTENTFGKSQIIACDRYACIDICKRKESCASCPIQEAINKLSAYEDTEMIPEEIFDMMAHNTALIEQLRDYEEQENEPEQISVNNADVLIVKPGFLMSANDMESMRTALIKQIEQGVVLLPLGFTHEIWKDGRKVE